MSDTPELPITLEDLTPETQAWATQEAQRRNITTHQVLLETLDRAAGLDEAQPPTDPSHE